MIRSTKTVFLSAAECLISVAARSQEAAPK
jgi:hypothetical protein